MLTASDFIRLPYTPDLTEGGIAYALKSLPYLFEPDPSEQLRRIIAETAVELAFRRYLAAHEIAFEISAPAVFSEHPKYQVMLNGRRCEVKSFFISRRAQINQIQEDPSVLLNAPALIPSEHFAQDEVAENSIYLFAFLCGLAASEDPHSLTHPMPPEWRKPFHWKALNPLSFKSENDVDIQVEVRGLDGSGTEQVQEVQLPPGKRIVLETPFHTVHALHVGRVPSGRIGIYSAKIGGAHIVPPQGWHDLWIHGMEIILTGFITRAGFRQQARMIAPNTPVFQYDHTKTKNLAMPISSLLPMRELSKPA